MGLSDSKTIGAKKIVTWPLITFNRGQGELEATETNDIYIS